MSPEMTVMVSRLEQRFNEARAEADARMERIEQRFNKERARGDKMEQRLNEERARGDKMELKHEEQDAEMKTMKQEQAELREQSKNQSKYIRHLMDAYCQSLQLSKRRMLEAARTQVFERIEDYKSYSVARLIKYIEEDAWGEFDEIDKWIVSAYADVSGEIHHDPDWFEALQVYQIGGDPDYGGNPNYRTVFSRLYHTTRPF